MAFTAVEFPKKEIKMQKLKITATGDSLFVADIPEEYGSDMKTVSGYIAKGEIRITNLETNISKFGDYPGAYSGGTWLNVEPNVFDDLTRYGFNFYGTANNHCMDYSYHGMLSTIDELDKRGLFHSGTGRSLVEASAPAIIDTDGGRVAIFAVDTSFVDASKAGFETKHHKARPGVNYLGKHTYVPIDEESVNALRRIAAQTNINARRELRIQGGFDLADPDGIFDFGGIKFCYDGSKRRTECNKRDLERIIADVTRAKEKYGNVIMLVHCHDIGKTKHEEVPEYLEEFAHALIDAGVCAVIGAGTHQLRPLEIYKGAPIFYSLGDFIYQGMRVLYLPADFMIKYGVDINAPAYDGLMARSKGGKIGLQAEKCNFESVIPYMEFENGKLTLLQMMPIVAGFDREGKMNGLPYHATGAECDNIFRVLSGLSEPYGTRLTLENNIISLALD